MPPWVGTAVEVEPRVGTAVSVAQLFINAGALVAAAAVWRLYVANLKASIAS